MPNNTLLDDFNVFQNSCIFNFQSVANRAIGCLGQIRCCIVDIIVSQFLGDLLHHLLRIIRT